jgi:DnaJ-class molecular chaperone
MKKPLKEGSEYCKECNGTGQIPVESTTHGSFQFTCPMCHGDGQFDWIEKITGKKTYKLDFLKENEIGLGYLSHPDNIYLDN